MTIDFRKDLTIRQAQHRARNVPGVTGYTTADAYAYSIDPEYAVKVSKKLYNEYLGFTKEHATFREALKEFEAKAKARYAA